MMPKFRSMYTQTPAEVPTHMLSDPDRWITPVGKIYRKLSIDELPQLWNILKGDMSFIGPRPELLKYTSQYTGEEELILQVRPGITGWAQIHGRKCVEWHERIRMNVWYVDNVSMMLDIKILFSTVFKVFANADNENVGATVGNHGSRDETTV